MITRKIMALATGAMLIASTGLMAQTKAPAAGSTKSAKAPAAATKSKVSTFVGTIKSADGGKLVVSKGTGTKAQDMTFMTDASTQKKGDMTPGAKATVHYKVENGNNMATSVTAAASKPAAKAPASSTTKSKTSGSTKTKLQ